VRACSTDTPEADRVFKAAKLVLSGKDPRDLVHQATNDALHADKVGQILCCTQAMAAWAVVSGKVPPPLVVAGYSVGELAAWGVAGLLDKRARAISSASLPTRTPWPSIPRATFMWPRLIGVEGYKGLSR